MSEEDMIQKRKEAAAKIAPNLGRKAKKEDPYSDEAMQKRKEAAAKIAPNLGQKDEDDPYSDDTIQKRKEAAAKIAPNLGKKHEKETDSAVADEASAKPNEGQAKSEAKQAETAEKEADTWQGLTEESATIAAPPAAQEYTIQAGDSLWAIADKFYHAGAKWNKIYEANKDVIGDNPSLIRPGQVIKIPNLDE